MNNFTVLVSKVKNYSTICIVGAGTIGIRLYMKLKLEGISNIVLMDNNYKNIHKFDGCDIYPISKNNENHCVYIVTANVEEYRQQLREQLLNMDISSNDIVEYYDSLPKGYFLKMDKEEYADELEKKCKQLISREFSLSNPSTFNEKIAYKKINNKDLRLTEYADKIKVREYVKNSVGEEYLTHIYKVWDNPDDIDLSELPDSFVIKMNNGSGKNIIIKDKEKCDIAIIKKQVKEWFYSNTHAYTCLELWYADIKPLIYCEEYLEGIADDLYDYDVFCFHGKAHYIWCINGSHHIGCTASFYDRDWNKQEFYHGYPLDKTMVVRPKQLEKMLELSERVASDFEHVRVDWMITREGKIIFSEMTFASWGGMMPFHPDKYDMILGNLI